MKAGLMEVADVFVVNKADRDGAHALMAELRFSVHLHHTSGTGPRDVDWEVPVLAAQAVHDVGIDELLGQVRRHRAALEQAGALEKRRQARRRAELEALLVEEFTAQISARVQTEPALARTLEAVTAGTLDPYSAVAQILAQTLKRP
jgi:LAO/AO transport system kinase